MDLDKNVPESEDNLGTSDGSQQQAENLKPPEENSPNESVAETEAGESPAQVDENQQIESIEDRQVTADEAESVEPEVEIAEATSEAESIETESPAEAVEPVSEQSTTEENAAEQDSLQDQEEEISEPEPLDVEKAESVQEESGDTVSEEPQGDLVAKEGSEQAEETEGAHEEEEHEEEIDYDHLEKDQLVKMVTDLSKLDDPRHFDKHLKPLKSRYDDLFDQEKNVALEAFVADGNEAGDFEYKGDEADSKFQDYYNLLRSKRSNFYNDLEKRKQENLLKKEELLEKLRELIDGEESDISIKGVRDLQDEWKKVGPVPGQHNKTLWANYNALLDRFYDARSIYFELKDLDRKKNLDHKLELCEKAEKLDELENVKDAVVQLNDLHEEFKHIGPVPREDQEALWVRFKAASDRIYVKRKDFVDHLKKSFDENLEKKQALAEKVEAFVSFDSDRISNWNKKTKEIQEIQRKWEAIGGVPRQQAKEINKRFWGSFKQFFANKSAFFKKFDTQREGNLDLKKKLVERAESMKDSQDWSGTTEAYKKLQAEWKEIGPVPEKFRNSIYEEFKKACDHFFEQRRSQNKEQEKAFEQNLSQKLEVCQEIGEIAKASELDIDRIYDLVDAFNELGFVPRNQIKSIQARFEEVINAVLESEALTDEDREDFRINVELGKLRGGPHANKKLFRKENSLKRKIETLESDINTWKTNMEFFASSKAADQLKKDFEEKITKAIEELKHLRKELRAIRQ